MTDAILTLALDRDYASGQSNSCSGNVQLFTAKGLFMKKVSDIKTVALVKNNKQEARSTRPPNPIKPRLVAFLFSASG